MFEITSDSGFCITCDNGLKVSCKFGPANCSAEDAARIIARVAKYTAEEVDAY